MSPTAPIFVSQLHRSITMEYLIGTGIVAFIFGVAATIIVQKMAGK